MARDLAGVMLDDLQPNSDPAVARIEGLIDLYGRSLSLVFLLLGLFHWAIIVGAFGDPGRFEAMSPEWKLATMNLAVADLVAGVGLWMRVAWGTVIWVYAALFEIAIYTLFSGTFGRNDLLAGFHFVTLAAFLGLVIAERQIRKRRRR